MNFKNLFARIIKDEQGQDIIEYALLAAFISIVAILAVQAIGSDVNTIYGNIEDATDSAATN